MKDKEVAKKLILSNYNIHKKIKDLSDNKYLNTSNKRNYIKEKNGYLNTISSRDYNDVYSTGVTLSTKNKKNNTIENKIVSLFDTYDYCKNNDNDISNKTTIANTNKEQLVKEQNKTKIIKRRLIKAKLHKILNNNYHSVCMDFINKTIEKDIGISEVLKSNYYINKQAHSSLTFNPLRASISLIDSVESYIKNNYNSRNDLFGAKLSHLLLNNFDEEDLQIIRDDYKYFFPKNLSVELNSHKKQLTLLEKLKIEENKSNIEILNKNKHNNQLSLLKQLSSRTVERQKKEIVEFDKAIKYNIDLQENNIVEMFDKTKQFIKQNYNIFKMKANALSNQIKYNKDQISRRVEVFNHLKNKILFEKPRLILKKPIFKKNILNKNSDYARLERVRISNMRVDNFKVLNFNKKYDDEQLYIQCLKNQETIKINYSSLI